MNLHSIAAHIMLLRRMFAFSGNKDPFGGKENRLIQLAWKVEPLSDQTDPGLIQDLLQELEIPISDGDGPTLVDVPNLHTVLDFWGTADMRLTSVHYLCRTEGGRVRLVRDTSHNTKYWKQDLIKVTMGDSIEEKIRERFSKTIPHQTKPKVILNRTCNLPQFIRIHCLSR